MDIMVYRDAFSDDCTLGTLDIDGAHFGYTCEDKDRRLESFPEAKIPGKTAIPRGRYRVVLSHSARFGKILPEVLNVPGFRGVRIHSGNTPADTDGCLLVGTVKDIRNWSVHRSREAMGLLQERIKLALDRGEKVYLEIV